jgi:hypothetical protein
MQVRFLVLGALAISCSSPLHEAVTSFNEARYPDAVGEFRAFRPDAGNSAELFQYALYRGLSHLALGDAKPAERWLTVAKRLWERSPKLASEDEQGRLLAAWRSMGHMPGD